MAKNKISEYSSTAANNTDIGGINISEGCAPSGINNAIRELMSQLKDQQAGTDSDNFTVGGNLSVAGAMTCTGAAVFSSTVAISSLASALPVTSGGTGLSSVTTGDILYSSGSNTLAKLAGAGTTGQALLSGTSAPSWGKVGLTTAVSGTLPIANGGTGLTSVGTDGQVLTSTGTAAAWEAIPVQPAVGVGQTWQNVAGSRSANGTVYTNSTSAPIMVSYTSGGGASLSVSYVVDSVTIGSAYLSSGNAMYYPFSFIVPAGSTYSITSSQGTTSWAELR